MDSTRIIFTEKSIHFVLEALGKSIDQQGYVIDENKKRVLDADGKEFKAKALIGIVKDKWITNSFQLFDLAE